MNVLGLVFIGSVSLFVKLEAMVKRNSPLKLTDDERDLLLDLHNQYRAKETEERPDSGKVAANIQRVRWNFDLEALAQKRAGSCIYGHRDLRLKNGDLVGQNIAALPPNTEPKWALYRWYKEKSYYNWENQACTRQCGHFIQMVFSETAEIGCAYKQCGETMMNCTFVVCNYTPLWRKGIHPYALADEPCSMCNIMPGSRCSEETDNLCEICDPRESNCVSFDSSKCKGRDPGIHPGRCQLLRKYGLCPKVNIAYWEQARQCGIDCGICVLPELF